MTAPKRPIPPERTDERTGAGGKIAPPPKPEKSDAAPKPYREGG